ncbi:hypothetical protein E4U37_000521, partial [Claviceps purpurea]
MRKKSCLASRPTSVDNLIAWSSITISAAGDHSNLRVLAIMGISRDSRHKRSASGAKRAYY